MAEDYVLTWVDTDRFQGSSLPEADISFQDMKPGDILSGEKLRFIYFVAPFEDGKAILPDLRKNVFPDAPGRFIRKKHGNQDIQVRNAYGANVKSLK